MSSSRTRKRPRARRPDAVQKPRGTFHPRVQKVGPEHFGIVSIDCAQARSEWMFADFYGTLLIPPTTVAHNRPALDAALDQLRQAIRDHDLKDLLVAIERMAREIGAALPKDATEAVKMTALNKALFAERGFHGSRGDYYHKSNSYLNEVIDDREGLPITLSVLYIELAKRLGLKVVGVGLPGHFIVRHVPAKGEAKLIDVYEGGKEMTRDEADKRVRAQLERPLQDDDLAATAKKAILVRMLQNLLGLAQEDQDVLAALRYLDAMVTITPDADRERWMRAVLRYNTRQREAAREGADWLIEHHPEGIDQKRVKELREHLNDEEK